MCPTLKGSKVTEYTEQLHIGDLWPMERARYQNVQHQQQKHPVQICWYGWFPANMGILQKV